jgi:predicted dehydrogenase
MNGGLKWSTDRDACLADPSAAIFRRDRDRRPAGACQAALDAGKHVYVEKPLAQTWRKPWIWCAAGGAWISRMVSCRTSCSCPGLPNCCKLYEADFFQAAFYRSGLDFGWWVFDGALPSAAAELEYRKAAGGGLILDMFAHWRYIFDRLLGEIQAVSCRHMTALPERRDETGNPYQVDVEDTAFAMFELAGGVLAQVSSSWTSRVKRDDLLQIQVDGIRGSAVCGLHRCFIQPLVATPKPFFDPERPQPMVFDEQWQEMPDIDPVRNGYRAGWELFLRHVAEDAPFPSSFLEGAKASS